MQNQHFENYSNTDDQSISRSGHPVLVIIDMQPRFPPSQDPATIAANLQLLHHAMRNGWFIIVVEFYGHGQTDQRILNALAIYRRFRLVPKFSDNGSEQIREVCSSHKLRNPSFIVGGVNTHKCIRATVTGMAIAMPDSRIVVVQNACNCDTDKDWSDFRRHSKNVVIRRAI